MKKMKKGFTIVELVIVIAVIAILAGVLIPTFTSVSENAKKSAALQNATSAVTAITVYDIDATDAEDVGADYYIQSGDYFFKVTGGQIGTTALDNKASDYTVDFDESNIVDLPKGIQIWKKA